MSKIKIHKKFIEVIKDEINTYAESIYIDNIKSIRCQELKKEEDKKYKEDYFAIIIDEILIEYLDKSERDSDYRQIIEMI